MTKNCFFNFGVRYFTLSGGPLQSKTNANKNIQRIMNRQTM